MAYIARVRDGTHLTGRRVSIKEGSDPEAVKERLESENDEIRVYLSDPPSMDTLREYQREAGCTTPCGCWVEPDGTCRCGNPSWMRILGLI